MAGEMQSESDLKDNTADKSYENCLLVDEPDFSDAEEFVDKVTDDGLNMLNFSNFSRGLGYVENGALVKCGDNIKHEIAKRAKLATYK